MCNVNYGNVFGIPLLSIYARLLHERTHIAKTIMCIVQPNICARTDTCTLYIAQPHTHHIHIWASLNWTGLNDLEKCCLHKVLPAVQIQFVPSECTKRMCVYVRGRECFGVFVFDATSTLLESARWKVHDLWISNVFMNFKLFCVSYWLIFKVWLVRGVPGELGITRRGFVCWKCALQNLSELNIESHRIIYAYAEGTSNVCLQEDIHIDYTIYIL